MTVAGVLPGVRRHLEGLADAAGGHHHRRRLEQDETAAFAPVPERPGDGRAVVEEFGDGAFGEHLDSRLVVAEFGVILLLQRDDLLLHGADQLQAGSVADMGQPRVGVPAEVALADPAVFGAVEQRAVGLQFPNPIRRLSGVQFSHPPVVQELPAPHRVAEMGLPGVLRIGVGHRSRAAALGHHRMRLAEKRFAHNRDPQAALTCLDDRTQPRAAGTDHDHVVGVPFDLNHEPSPKSVSK